MALKINSKAPDFSLPSTSGKTFRLADFIGQPVILYFYPKDFTPGCTKEACSFRDHFDVFRQFDINIFGISTDSIEKHNEFKAKHNLNFELLSDLNGKVSEQYDALMPFVKISKRITYLLNSEHQIIGVYDNLFAYEKHIQKMVDSLSKKG